MAGFVPLAETASDAWFLAWSIHDLTLDPSAENLGWALADAGMVALPLLPSSPFRAIKRVLKATDNLPVGKADEAVDAGRVATNSRVAIIGEDMSRVRSFPGKYGNEYMPDLPSGNRLAANRAWTSAHGQGLHNRELGPAPGRQFYPAPTSAFYNGNRRNGGTELPAILATLGDLLDAD